MSHRILSRHRRNHYRALDQAAVDKAIGEATVTETPRPIPAGGDTRRLRGIPVIARGVPGTSPGTNPQAT